MKWASAVSTHPSLELALREVIERVLTQLETAPNLAIIFISSAFASEYSRVLPLLKGPLGGAHIIGCSGSGVIGRTKVNQLAEVEDAAGISLTAAYLPNVDIQGFHLSIEELPDLDSPPSEWTEIIGVAPVDQPHFLLMADPFASGMNDLLQGLDFAYPDSVKVGGLAGIESISRSCGLFCGQQLYRQGVVGVALSGNIMIDAIVAQGCRPIGPTFRVVEGDRNVVTKVAAQGNTDDDLEQTPLEALQELFQDLDETDRQLAQESLFIGLAQSGFKQSLGQGDFLIRNLVGVDPKVGAIAIADRIRPGQRIQFHLRDADTARDDLATLLAAYRLESKKRSDVAPSGALLFACNGRGTNLFDMPDCDTEQFSRELGPIPLGGFFCSGEIGPVGNTTFLHGFTSVFGICRALNDAETA
ncbi:FIST signal transduction protein [Leptothoe kymatousa]|uniref:FIST C-terminal domain-containing protein n=1 Tax=Leptothoe kymatousa TAU-MAC 1615 TaxID=2364775 RepID=A0ABS5Y3G0_9CYAN|nr:FIST N-terminal domain-containing protein [Leptothoe kymatousa]MBT9312352.1 FIST C-terminal domain-containing protein [Leptothoe kymatousa TAU-MAC 1615]